MVAYPFFLNATRSPENKTKNKNWYAPRIQFLFLFFVFVGIPCLLFAASAQTQPSHRCLTIQHSGRLVVCIWGELAEREHCAEGCTRFRA